MLCFISSLSFLFFFLLLLLLFHFVLCFFALTIQIGLELYQESSLLVIKVNKESLLLISHIKLLLGTIPQGRVEAVLLTRLS